MFSFIAQSDSIAAGIDLTNDLSSLLVGLVTLLVLLAGMIACEAVRYHFAQQAQTSPAMAPATIEYRMAA